jgi:hypothetical protein
MDQGKGSCCAERWRRRAVESGNAEGQESLGEATELEGRRDSVGRFGGELRRETPRWR